MCGSYKKFGGKIMPINLHFFRNNELEKLDYSKVFEFFDNYPAFTIFYGEDDVQIICSDDDFKFTYRYLVTKKSRVKDIDRKSVV